MAIVAPRYGGGSILNLAASLAGDFGGPPARTDLRHRTGDLLAVPRRRRQLHWAWKESDRSVLHRGGHGGWSADEMLVPLVAIPLG